MKKSQTATNGRNGERGYRGVQIRPDLRLALYLRDRFTCVYCLADLHGAHPQDVTLDHLVCDSDGGGNDPRNLVTACRACNCSRKDTPLRRFASAEARAHIRRNTARKIEKYRRLAKSIIAGESSDPRKTKNAR